MIDIAENEQIKPRLWQWVGGICLFFDIILKIIGAASFAKILGIFSQSLLFVIILFCVPIFRYVAKKIYIKNLYGQSFIVGFIGWSLLQFIVLSVFSVLLMGFNVLGTLIISLVTGIFYAPIYMIIAVLLIKYKKQYFVEIGDNADTVVAVKQTANTSKGSVWSCSAFSMIIPEESDKKPIFALNGFAQNREEVDQNGNPILRWGSNSLLGLILSIPISLHIILQLPVGMAILVYLFLGFSVLLLTSMIGAGIFALAGKILKIKDVLIKSIIIGVVGYSLYYFGIYYFIYSDAIESAYIQEDRLNWIYMTCAMHVAISTFLYVFLMVREQRKEIFLIGAPIVLFYWFYWYTYF